MGRGLSKLQKSLLVEVKHAGEDGVCPCTIVRKRFDRLPKKQQTKMRWLLLTVVIGKSLKRLARRELLTLYGPVRWQDRLNARRYRYVSLSRGHIPLDSGGKGTDDADAA
jgi:hypothetical protein